MRGRGRRASQPPVHARCLPAPTASTLRPCRAVAPICDALSGQCGLAVAPLCDALPGQCGLAVSRPPEVERYRDDLGDMRTEIGTRCPLRLALRTHVRLTVLQLRRYDDPAKPRTVTDDRPALQARPNGKERHGPSCAVPPRLLFSAGAGLSGVGRSDDQPSGAERERLRAGAGVVAELAFVKVRADLDAGGDPVDAMLAGVAISEAWLEAVGEPGFAPPAVYAARVRALLDELAGKLGEAAAWRWMLTAHDPHAGSPLEQLVAHRVSGVAWQVAQLPPAERSPTAPTAGGAADSQPPEAGQPEHAGEPPTSEDG